jgi:hypothetical protein
VNDDGGGVRETLSQEAVQEFQINRGNYSAELGGASGAVINIVSKAGTNHFHGSTFGFFRNQRLDAADPFAIDLVNDNPVRVKPPSNRQQFGATLGGPLKGYRTLFFLSFEGLRRRESNAVPVLTDVSVFGPTADQQRILAALPQSVADQLRPALTSSPATRELLRMNSGVFPFSSSDYNVSGRIDHQVSPANQLMLRYGYAKAKETNPNTRALVGVTRGFKVDTLDSNLLLSWTHLPNARTANQLRAQFSYRNSLYGTTDPFGPEININGYGFFNRDAQLPSYTISRRYDVSENLTLVRGSHTLKLGGNALIRGSHNDVQLFFGGRFTFAELPGGAVNALLASTTITALQAFNLGLPQIYQQGFGDPIVASTIPFYAGYIQDSWKAAKNLVIDFGIRYELDDRTDPVRTDTNNFAPRFGFVWDPWGNGKTTVRGGYGIFYSPNYYQLDYVANALNDLNGHRQIAQIFTTLLTPGAASAANIYQTLLRQGVIHLPSPTRTISPADIAQFGLSPVHDGPIPPQSILFRAADNFVNPYSQQGSFGFDRALTNRLSIGASYTFARTLKIIRARDQNLLPAPIDPRLGIRVWTPQFFKQPLLLQDNLYESSGRAFYHGLVLEFTKRFSHHFSANANYTFSKAIDEVVDFNSDFQATDQTNLNAERALSAFDQRHKLVVYGTVETARSLEGFQSIFSNIAFNPIVRANSARPFNLLAGVDLNADRHPTTDRPAFAGRNTGIGPNFWTVDLRLGKTIPAKEQAKIEITAEALNVFNRLNFKSVNSTVGNMQGPFNVHGRRDRRPSEPLGFTSAYEPRRIQLGVRVTF